MAPYEVIVVGAGTAALAAAVSASENGAARVLALEKTNWALKLDQPPFYACTATGGITFTFGGLKVDENARVIGTDWRPVPGLHACGEMISGLFYDNRPAGAGLVSGATFGRIAGRSAAQLQSNSRALEAAS